MVRFKVKPKRGTYQVIVTTTERRQQRIEEEKERKRGEKRDKDKELIIRNGPTTMSTPLILPLSMFRNNR
jgi:hypothetical protein